MALLAYPNVCVEIRCDLARVEEAAQFRIVVEQQESEEMVGHAVGLGIPSTASQLVDVRPESVDLPRNVSIANVDE